MKTTSINIFLFSYKKSTYIYTTVEIINISRNSQQTLLKKCKQN